MEGTHVDHPTWDDFADFVLPWVGLEQLGQQIQAACPMLGSERSEYWVGRFNEASVAAAAQQPEDGAPWSPEERDGIWYDRMKATALDCIDEAHGRRTTSVEPRQH